MDKSSISTSATASQSVRPPKQKLGWFEKRDRRRRRRLVFEEILAWILVPAFLYLMYWGLKAAGGVPKEVRDFAGELVSIVLRGGK
jgi:hypothetical protein